MRGQLQRIELAGTRASRMQPMAGPRKAPSAAVSAIVKCLELARMLNDAGVGDRAENHDLIRRLERTLQRLRRPLVGLVLEYGHRCRRKGAARARAWYWQRKQQQVTHLAWSSAVMAGHADHVQSRDSIVYFRSRLLRGPPGK